MKSATRKKRVVKYDLPISTENMLALIATISMNAERLRELYFQPYIILTLIHENKTLVKWLVNFFDELPEENRKILFKDVYGNEIGTVDILKESGIPPFWLEDAEFSLDQYDRACDIKYNLHNPAYTESNPGPRMYAHVSNIEVKYSGITTRSISNISPPVSPGAESGIIILSQAATSAELDCDLTKLQTKISRDEINESKECSIM